MNEKKEEQEGVQSTGIIASTELLKGAYTNVARISHTQNEFVLDFLMQAPEQTILLSRVIMNPRHMMLFQKAINENIKLFNQSKSEKKTQKNS